MRPMTRGSAVLRDARARARDDAVDALALLVEAREQRAFEHAAARQLDAQRIDEAAVHQDLVVHVRAGREAGRADIADHLALADARAGLGRARERGHVAVGGLVAVGVVDADVFAVAALPADLLDRAVAGGVDRGAERGGPVDAGVHLVIAEQRMIAGAEAGPHDSGRRRACAPGTSSRSFRSRRSSRRCRRRWSGSDSIS